jgi:hypothetical protein
METYYVNTYYGSAKPNRANIKRRLTRILDDARYGKILATEWTNTKAAAAINKFDWIERATLDALADL